MPKMKQAWGLDVGQTALKAVKLRQAGEKVEVAAYEVIEHPKLLSDPDADTISLTRQALTKFMEKHQPKSEPVVISIPGQSSWSKFVSLPPVEPKKIPEIVRFEAIQQIPFNIEDVVWDYQIVTEPDSPEVTAGIFCIRDELIRKVLADFTATGVPVDRVQMAPMALYNYLLYDRQVQPGKATLLLDIGTSNSELVVAEENRVWNRTIPLGGNNFTQSLVKAFKLSFAKAENLKRTAGTSKYARQVFQAMRPVFSDLVAEIQRSLGFYTAAHRDVTIYRMLGLGNGFRLPGLQKFIHQNLQIEVARLAEFNAVVPASDVSAGGLEENTSSLAVAYGLAIQGLGLGAISSSLVPADVMRRRLWGRKKPWFFAAAASIALASIAYNARSLLDAKNLNQGDTRWGTATAGIIQKAETFSQQYAQEKNQGKEELDRIEDIFTTLNYRTLWPKIYQVVESSLPAEEKQLYLSDAAQIKKIPRSQRKQVQILSFEAQYSPDVDTGATASKSGSRQMTVMRAEGFRRGPRGGSLMPMGPGMGPGMMPGGPSPEMMGSSGRRGRGARTQEVSRKVVKATRRGFIITLEGVTPHRSGATFIQREFVSRLVKNGQGKGLGFRFEDFTILKQELVSRAGSQLPFPSAEDMEKGKSLPSGGVRGRPGGAAGGPMGPEGMMMAPAGGRRRPAARGRTPFGGPAVPGRRTTTGLTATGLTGPVDPLTGESMRDDTWFVLRWKVVVGVEGPPVDKKTPKEMDKG